MVGEQKGECIGTRGREKDETICAGQYGTQLYQRDGCDDFSLDREHIRAIIYGKYFIETRIAFVAWFERTYRKGGQNSAFQMIVFSMNIITQIR
jgi:hypothetical protein